MNTERVNTMLIAGWQESQVRADSGLQHLAHYELGIWMNASTCEYFMQLRMQQLEMIALELNFACAAIPSEQSHKIASLVAG